MIIHRHIISCIYSTKRVFPTARESAASSGPFTSPVPEYYNACLTQLVSSPERPESASLQPNVRITVRSPEQFRAPLHIFMHRIKPATPIHACVANKRV